MTNPNYHICIRWLIGLALLCTNSYSIIAQQQLCDGNLGDNIFDDGDFGRSRTNVLLNDPGIAPGYLYHADASSPPDGSYVITNNTSSWGFYFPTWLRLSDNSPEPEGYFMLVNADINPGLFYEEIVDGLCENTLYEFSADVINVVRRGVPDHILPNISFLLNDELQVNSGNVPQDESWHTYGFTFMTEPGQTSLKLSLRNNAPGGNGNDLALDNISFRACGPSAFVNTVQRIFLCEDDNNPAEITAEINATNQALQWQFSLDSLTWEDLPGENDLSVFHNIFDAGVYYYRYITAGTEVELLNDKCWVASDILPIEVTPIDHVDNKTICEGELYQFGTQSLTEEGDYFEQFISSRGCDSFVNLTLSVLPDENLVLDIQAMDPLCFESMDGSIAFDVVGGNRGPYTSIIGEIAAENNQLDQLTSGDYNIIVTDSQGCTTTSMATLTDPPLLTVSLPSDTTVSLGDIIVLTPQINQVVDSVIWLPHILSDCSDCESLEFTPFFSGTHGVQVQNANGCIAYDELNIDISIDNLPIYIPTAILPTAIGADNNFTIGAKSNLITTVQSFQIYDRWGGLIHSVRNTESLNLWDGRSNNRPVEQGVYPYVLELILLDGNLYTFMGNVTIFR